MYRKFLLIGTIFLLATGLLATCSVFVISLKPNKTTLYNLPHIDISTMKTGDIKEYKTSWSHVFILKQNEINDKFKVFSVPMRDGKYQLPEFGWHRPVLPCVNFVQDYGFQCLDRYDDDTDIVWWSYMKWDKFGISLSSQKKGTKVPDFFTTRYMVKGNQVILFHR